MLSPVKLTLILCVYAAAMYSCMRSCMEETKTPGLPGPIAFMVALFWLPLMAAMVAIDVAKGVQELFTGRK
jgi:hypothetical protein